MTETETPSDTRPTGPGAGSSRRNGQGRFRPHRAGIVNLWDYGHEVFEFADGRLVLRGPNGSGKTKALEVLFPYVLDANLSPRRLDPFSGEGRSMKQNLLYRGDREANHGYVWMEFARRHGDGTRDTVTIGAGLRAHRHREGVTSWYFVTDRSPGSDLSLLDPEGRPLTRKQLAEELGDDDVFERATDYRERVDRALFGLGRERYESLVHLVLYLRRPHLARDLDIRRLSDILSQGLRPLDEGLLDGAARSFEDLEAVQRELDALEATRAAVDAFLDRYRQYVRATARARVDRALAARDELDAARRSVAEATERHRKALEERAAAEARARDVRAELDDGRAEREALLASDAYRDAHQLEQLESWVREKEGEVEQSAARLEQATERSEGLAVRQREAEARVREAATERRDAEHAVRTAAEACGVTWAPDDTDDADDADGLRHHLQALVAARRADVEEVRSLAGLSALAADRVEAAEARVADAASRVDDTDEACRVAEAAAEQEQQAVLDALDAWAADLDEGVVGVATLDGLAAAVTDRDVPVLEPLLASHLAPRRDAQALERERAARRVDELDAEIGDRREERERIAAEADDAPPPPHTRSADRTGRRGAPLWRLVDFHSDLDEHARASLEAALEASGVLDAWVAPDGSLRDTAGDTFLAVPDDHHDEGDRESAGDRRTLDDVLVAAPDEGTGVAEAVVDAVLARMALVERAGAETGDAVGGDGSFRVGPLAGSWSKPAAQYVGAAARAEHRRRRLEALDAELARLADARGSDEARRRAAETTLLALDHAAETLPSTDDLVDARRALERAGARLAEARGVLDGCRADLDRSHRAALDARRALEREAGARSLPTHLPDLDATARAVDRFDGDGRDLVAVTRRLAERRASLDEASGDLRAQEAEVARVRDELDTHRRRRRERHQQLETLRDTLGADATAVLDRLTRLDRRLEDLSRDERTTNERHIEAIERVGQAEGAVGGARDQLDTAERACEEAEGRLAVFERHDLLACLRTEAPSEEPAGDPDAGEAAGDEPPALTELLDRATAGAGAAPDALASIRGKVFKGFETLMTAMGSSYHPEYDLDDDVITVAVVDDEGIQSLAGFAAKLARLCDEQAALLSTQERKVFEDTLLASLCSQLHERILETREQVRRMNESLEQRRTSSGLRIRLRWEPLPDESPERREVERLLDQDPALLGTAERDRLRDHFAGEIQAARATRPGEQYRTLLADVLDHRRWRRFTLRLVHPDGRDEALGLRAFNRLSGGEKATALHLPLFAAASAHYSTARADTPRLVALDEAFAGIDDDTRARLLGLTVEFDLDLFLTGHDLWATHPTVPAVAIYDLMHLREDHTVHALAFRWDGSDLTPVDDEVVAGAAE